MSDSHLPLEMLAAFTSQSGPQSARFSPGIGGEPCPPGRPGSETRAALPVEPSPGGRQGPALRPPFMGASLGLLSAAFRVGFGPLLAVSPVSDRTWSI